MATATAQDDDLLIIADDNVTNESSDDIEFSFDFGEDITEAKKESSETDIKVEEIAEKKELPSVSESTPVEATREASSEATEAKTEVPTDSPDIDLGINFDSIASDETKTESVAEVKAEAVQEVKTEEFSFDLWEVEKNEEKVAETTQAAPITSEPAVKVVEKEEATVSTSDDTSMNDILSNTIAKLEARQEVIATDKAGKASKEEEIKAQIKELESQLKELESDMNTLDSESDKITANIVELEKMKLDPVKEHNAKRAKK